LIFLYDVELIPSYVRFTLVDLATSFSGALGLEHEEGGEQVVQILSLAFTFLASLNFSWLGA